MLYLCLRAYEERGTTESHSMFRPKVDVGFARNLVDVSPESGKSFARNLVWVYALLFNVIKTGNYGNDIETVKDENP